MWVWRKAGSGVGSERCNCLCPGCLRSNLERQTRAGCFNSLIATLLRDRRADHVPAPAPASCAVTRPAAKLPKFGVQHFRENNYISPYALKCHCGSGAASRSDSTNLVLRFLVLNQKLCGRRPQIADVYTHAWAQISSKHNRLTLHQQPLCWTGCCLLTSSCLNLHRVHGPIWQKRDRMPDPELGQMSTAGCSSNVWVFLCWVQSPALLGGRAAGSNLANLPQLICWGEFNRVPVKPAEEVSTLQLFVFVPLRLLVTSIVLMQLLVRLHAEPGHWSKWDKNMLFWEGVIIKQNYSQSVISSTVFQIFIQTDLRSKDLSHMSGQATVRKLEASRSGFANKANAW